MVIVINGQRHEVRDDLTVQAAVALLTTRTTGVAVAVNGEVVRRQNWPSARLAPGDQVEVITAVQGG